MMTIPKPPGSPDPPEFHPPPPPPPATQYPAPPGPGIPNVVIGFLNVAGSWGKCRIFFIVSILQQQFLVDHFVLLV